MEEELSSTSSNYDDAGLKISDELINAKLSMMFYMMTDFSEIELIKTRKERFNSDYELLNEEEKKYLKIFFNKLSLEIESHKKLERK